MSHDDIEVDITLDEAELIRGGTATLRFRTTTRTPVRIRGAHAHFIGYEETEAVYVTSTGKTTTVSVATERNLLVEKRETFQGRAHAGFFRNLADGALTLLGGGDHDELPRGSHDVLLKVDLPAELSESVFGKKVKVVYEAAIDIDIPVARDFRHSVTFALGPPSGDDDLDPAPLTIRYPEDAKRGFFDAMFGPEVAMRIELPATVVRRGGTVAGTLEVRFPDRPATVEAIVCHLLRHERSQAHGHADHHAEPIATARLEQRQSDANHLLAPFEVRLPEAMIPTCTGAKFTVAYELAVSLDVPWAKDPTIRIPITVV
jgi:hypothetical protein